MTKRVSLTIGTILLIIAFCFVAVAVNHPEAAFPWSNRVTFMLYGAYIWLLFKFLIATPFLKQQSGSLLRTIIYLLMAIVFLVMEITGETVVLLSHKKADSYIHIDVEFGEGEGKIPVDSIAKRAEAYKPKEKVTYKMIKEYIEAKYGFKVHTAYIAEVKRNLGLPMYDAPNAVEELKQPRKHPTPEKVEAIKDALRYFAVI